MQMYAVFVLHSRKTEPFPLMEMDVYAHDEQGARALVEERIKTFYTLFDPESIEVFDYPDTDRIVHIVIENRKDD